MQTIKGMYISGHIKFCQELGIINQIQKMYAPLFTSLLGKGDKVVEIFCLSERRPVGNEIQNIEHLCIGVTRGNLIKQLFQAANGCCAVERGSPFGCQCTGCYTCKVIIYNTIEHYKVKLHIGRHIGKFRINSVVCQGSSTNRNIIAGNAVMFCHFTVPAFIVMGFCNGVTQIQAI